MSTTDYEYARTAQLARLDLALDQYRYRGYTSALDRAQRVADEADALSTLEAEYEREVAAGRPSTSDATPRPL